MGLYGLHHGKKNNFTKTLPKINNTLSYLTTGRVKSTVEPTGHKNVVVLLRVCSGLRVVGKTWFSDMKLIA